MSADSDGRLLVTAHLLRHLLRSPRYVKRWRTFSERVSGDIHQAAIAEVLALHLWDTGISPESDHALPRRLKDTVSRALSGASLSARTLTWFIEAFEMSADDAAALWNARLGAKANQVVPVVIGTAEGPETVAASPHQTLSLHELHTVGPDGIPTEHRTVQVVRATAPMDRYTFRCDTSAVSVHVIRGGQAQPARAEGPGLCAIDILLPRPMAAGDTAAFEFRTVLHYAVRPATEFRRAAYRHTQNVEIGVHFHPSCLPARTWSADWQRHDDDVPVRTTDVELDQEASLHRYVAVLEHATIGFGWAFAS